VKKSLKSVYIYGSYRKIKTGVSLFGPPCVEFETVIDVKLSYKCFYV